VNLVTELHAVCAMLVRAQIRYAICLPEGPLWVVPREVLLAMSMAGRSQDLADLEKLEAGDD
jgi:hypothetical protein